MTSTYSSVTKMKSSLNILTLDHEQGRNKVKLMYKILISAHQEKDTSTNHS